MHTKALKTRRVSVQLPTYLSRRIERTARLSKCHVSKVVASALATSLLSLPDALPSALAEELAGWLLLDDEALRAIAQAFHHSLSDADFPLYYANMRRGS